MFILISLIFIASMYMIFIALVTLLTLVLYRFISKRQPIKKHAIASVASNTFLLFILFLIGVASMQSRAPQPSSSGAQAMGASEIVFAVLGAVSFMILVGLVVMRLVEKKPKV